MLAEGIGFLEASLIVVYLGLVGFLGYLGYRRTQTTADYLLAGRKVHPFVMALSYGATFISTSAIVGFGGVAGLFGMSLMWLVFLNILVGVFIAFVFLGPTTRRMGHRLDAHTFPEFLGRRYQSKFIQIFAGLLVFLFIPLYSAAVLIGGTEFIGTQFGVSYHMALVTFTLIIATYVIFGGLKGVMYTDALQGSIMCAGMLVLVGATYWQVGGVTEGHRALGELADLVPGPLAAMGHQGWTAMPAFGWGDPRYNLWWIVISTITLGVGIGVLAQPQLVVRFMTVRSRKELNRAVLIGGVFILIMVGVVYVVGSLSNVYFTMHGPALTGRVVRPLGDNPDHVLLQMVEQDAAGQWVDARKPDGSPQRIPVVIDRTEPTETVALASSVASAGDVATGTTVELVRGRSITIVYAKGNPDQVIPTYITEAMPKWFSVVFLLTLLAAAMSTLSSQFHALGTSIGRDVYEQLTTRPAEESSARTMLVVRLGIVVGILIALGFGFYARGGYIVARATAIFFGLCSSAFLPSYLGGLWWRRGTRAGAIASMVAGALVTAFWLLFIKAKEAGAIGLVQLVTDGKPSLLAHAPNWPVVDPIAVALPVSVLVYVGVSLLTRPLAEAHLDRCYGR